MASNWLSRLDGDVLDQLAGVAGVGWTASLLGYLGTLVGYGNGLVGRLVTDPQALLYVGVACFLATAGLDRLADRLADR